MGAAHQKSVEPVLTPKEAIKDTDKHKDSETKENVDPETEARIKTQVCLNDRTDKLELKHLKISVLPSTITQLYHLTSLSLEMIPFTTFPLEICRLSNLKELNLSGASFSLLLLCNVLH